jgi:hypothetical protein
MDKADAQGAAQDRHLAEWQNSAQNQRARSEYPGRANSFGGPQKDLPSEVFTPIDGRLVGSNEDHRAPDRTQQQYDQAFAEFQAENKRPTNITIPAFGKVSGNMDPDTAAKISGTVATAQAREQTRRAQIKDQPPLSPGEQRNQEIFEILKKNLGDSAVDKNGRKYLSEEALNALPTLYNSNVSASNSKESTNATVESAKLKSRDDWNKALFEANMKAQLEDQKAAQAVKAYTRKNNIAYYNHKYPASIDGKINPTSKNLMEFLSRMTPFIAAQENLADVTDPFDLPTGILGQYADIYQNTPRPKHGMLDFTGSPEEDEYQFQREAFKRATPSFVNPNGEPFSLEDLANYLKSKKPQ